MNDLTFKEAVKEVEKIAKDDEFSIEYYGNWEWPDNIEITIDVGDDLAMGKGTTFKEAIKDVKLNLNIIETKRAKKTKKAIKKLTSGGKNGRN